MRFKLSEESLSFLDGPWISQQVKSHLFFGHLSRHFGFGWIVVIAFTLNFAFSLSTSLTAAEIPQFLQNIFFLAISFIFLKMSNYRQAALGWCLTKIILALFCFLILIALGLVEFFQHSPGAIYAIMLSIIWFPSLEFVSSLQQKQKIIKLLDFW
jgi:hypothetical protein